VDGGASWDMVLMEKESGEPDARECTCSISMVYRIKRSFCSMASNPSRLYDTSLKPPNFSFACTARRSAVCDPFSPIQPECRPAKFRASDPVADAWGCVGLQLAPRDTKARDLLTSALAECRADNPLPPTT